MAAADDLATIIEQERRLVFAKFDEAEAFRLGSLTREMGLEAKLPIIVDIRFWDRPLFYAALPGSAGANAEWARRKVNSVRHYLKSTYRLFLEQGAGERIFAPDHGLDPADHAIAGGAFPLSVAGAGTIGAVAISGLPQRDDHGLVVRALCRHLGIEDPSLHLPAADGE